MSRLILASRSPRRCELLSRLGFPFETVVPDLDETCSLPVDKAVQELSRRKAAAVAEKVPHAFIVAADTLVSIGSHTLGKPSCPEDAVRMLTLLSGQTHQVFSGITVISPEGMVRTGFDRTDVTFCDIPREEIMAYVRSGEPLDKAGSYALQGRAGLWVVRLEGSDTSVIGLPLYLLRQLLLETGYPLTSSMESSTM